jgi:predicted glycoside hydrolase/deacetylase ChbG (UPF0249 family)
VPGLVDAEGFLRSDVASMVFSANPDEVETEIRAQLERCRTLGVTPTHLDSHSGTVFVNPVFFERYVKKVIAEENIVQTTWRELKQRRDKLKKLEKPTGRNP